MPRPPIDLAAKIHEIVDHVAPLPPEASFPLSHFARTSAEIWNLVKYFERKVGQTPSYAAVSGRHLARFNGMVLVSLIENFERFLKETAAVCVDQIADRVADDRFGKGFPINANSLVAHFQAGTLGRSLCESLTWLDCKDADDRFRRILAPPFEAGAFHLFPTKGQKPTDEIWRTEALGVVWQLRHSVVHNVSVITASDAAKLRVLTRRTVQAPRSLAPTRDDLRFLSRFLDESAASCNARIGQALASTLTAIDQDTPGLFDPAIVAGELVRAFGIPITVSMFSATPPAPTMPMATPPPVA